MGTERGDEMHENGRCGRFLDVDNGGAHVHPKMKEPTE